ncbi:acyltransferase family protein [Hydrogenophaga sp. PAMC20947]|uniref:acyltransferase family protein n=1 Tax=Hydrogenophaga sp. PAMC20947 TaxID=2565558 RepID=UPI00109D8D3B|nr:acyltransferase family protein [Hydrogenophaga sp. PAMC20947]QCB46356.1 acyltransferase [Hydrogenophaga sp. PAMC20947]
MTEEHSGALPRTHYRPDIDGLRAIAVIAVVLHHAMPAALRGGFVGVDVFFVISGYLISSIVLTQLSDRRFSFANFYARRIRRIFPALILVLLGTFAVGWWWMTPLDLKHLGKHMLAGISFLANVVFWREAGYFDDASSVKPLLHLWSLSIEEQFYLLWPLSLWVLHRWRANALRWTLALLLASWVFNMVLVRNDPTAAYYHPLGRFWELMVGALLASMHVYQVGWRGLVGLPGPGSVAPVSQSLWRKHLLAIMGLVLLYLAFSRIHPERKFPGGWALLPTVGTALLIAAGPHAWLNRRVLSFRPLVWIGLISYPLYLWHWPLMAFANLKAGGQASTSVLASLALVSVLLAWLTYVLVEIPVRYGRFNRRAVTGLLIGLMFGIGALSIWNWRQNGFETRFPSIVRDMTARGGSAVITEGWRYHDCILEPGVDPSHYKDFCIEENRRPLVFLWGDSHAASLYPGFKALQDGGKFQFGIGERAGAICPPILGTNPRPMCLEQNESNMEAIRRSRPDIVILYAWWHHPRYDLKPLEATIAEIRRAGVSRIILLGAVPYWHKPLPQLLMDAWRKGPYSQPPPLRLLDGLDPQLTEITAQMRARSKEMGIEFISGMQFFCDEEGCLTRLNEEAKQPLSYDYGHLSTSAVIYYVEQLAPLIFQHP